MKIIKWETIRKRYGKRMERAMQSLYVDLRDNLPELGASEPFTMDCDSYSVVIRLQPRNQPQPVDVSFEIFDAMDYEGEPSGYNFGLSVVAEGGRILGQFHPFNYSPQVWVNTSQAIEERFTLVENAATDSGSLAELLLNNAA